MVSLGQWRTWGTWVVVVTEPDGTKLVYGPMAQGEAEVFAADLMGPESDGSTLAEAVKLSGPRD